MFCLNCNSETTNPKFCSSSCNAIYNNKRRVKTTKATYKCLHCDKEVVRRPSKTNQYCSIKCQQSYTRQQRFENLENGGTESPGQIKRYINEHYGYYCSGCGISDWLGEPISLELEHKDGNSDNNTLENCCLLCPNCHSQTPTYKSKNKGNGRHKRKLRYQQGLSY